MSVKARSLWLAVLSLAGVAFMSGCATNGPAFAKVETIPADKGLIYIYRPQAFQGGAVSYDVRVNDAVVTHLSNGGYYPYFAAPGEAQVSAKTEATSSVTLDVKAGQTYYVKGGVRIGFLVGRPHLMVMANDVGASEIADCKLIIADKPESK